MTQTQASFYRGGNSSGRLNNWARLMGVSQTQVWLISKAKLVTVSPHNHLLTAALHSLASVLQLFVQTFPCSTSTLPGTQGTGWPGPGSLSFLYSQSTCTEAAWMREWMMFPGHGSGQGRELLWETTCSHRDSEGFQVVGPYWAQTWGSSPSEFLGRAERPRLLVLQMYFIHSFWKR